jgi:hypothetical protein
MKLIVTMMVRDEADIVAAMIDHHLAQGVDYFIVTDNGSIDGTTEILQEYSDRGVLELRHDPVHRKQQAPTVTAMARAAYTEHGADWVLNADADEFWIPQNRDKTLRENFASIPKEIQAFPVPVIDMIGEPAMDGSGLSRLIYRDQRSLERLHSLGLHAHSTPDVAHIGHADVEVVQGNHYVNITSLGLPSADDAIEVLHLPWRSWRQYSHKVSNAGRAYEESDMTPSPNHHGMRDYRRLKDGSLFGWYLLRHPDRDELETALASGHLVEDSILATRSDTVPDVPITDPSARSQRAIAAAAGEFFAEWEQAESERAEARAELARALNRLDTANAELIATHELLRAERSRKVVRLANALSRATRRPGNVS